MVRPEDQTRPLAALELLKRRDLGLRRFFFGDQVVESEDHERVRVGEDALVER